MNLPPGTRASDLPGNTKADQDAEAMAERLTEILGKVNFAEDSHDADEAIFALMKLIDDEKYQAYQDGYNDGVQAQKQDYRENDDENADS